MSIEGMYQIGKLKNIYRKYIRCCNKIRFIIIYILHLWTRTEIESTGNYRRKIKGVSYA